MLYELYACKETRFDEIGSISSRKPEFCDDIRFPWLPYRMISQSFFWNSRIGHDVPGGAFTSTAEWLTSYLLLYIKENKYFLKHLYRVWILPACIGKKMYKIKKRFSKKKSVTDQDYREWALDINKRLLYHLDNFIPNNDKTVSLHHDDIHKENILVDPTTGAITAILDWECVSTAPLWKVCQPPRFLNQDRLRLDQPLREDHAPDTEDHDGGTYLFNIHVEHWEMSVLRQTYLDHMKSKDLEWYETFMSPISKRASDFYSALTHLEHRFGLNKASRWLHILDSGNERKEGAIEFNMEEQNRSGPMPLEECYPDVQWYYAY